MITSMTAFVRSSQEAEWGILTWEIRTVNHRYLEISLGLPDFFRDFEQSSRGMIQKYLNRGKVEAVLRFQPGQRALFEITVNQPLTERLAKVSEMVITFFPGATIDVMDILSYPGVLQTKEAQVNEMNEAISALLEKTLIDCVNMRSREGRGLQTFIEDRLHVMKKQLVFIQKRIPMLMQLAHEKIMTSFKKLSLNLDKSRLEQEMLWIIQKIDVAEELQRLEAHLAEIRRILNDGGVVGRRLDFLMQELNREVNTLGSKLLDIDVSESVVELKVQIEQMREQIQNIE
ncbi:MAG: YicC/YloC family endoribonuclease [Coxiella-like endosymbiont]|uniref:YicC/YloC family endoribonuclease n=1 Tax=Coxiella-like endosymbiont TaxID=1592897 RepID=UPI00215B029A|nr:YicC/YloC family endoribonuclease [Coxiella-like endosymbiont]UVE59743.1 YicC family protein [Coxiella-like endosymbiont]